MSTINISEVKRYLLGLQEHLCQGFSDIDGKKTFFKDEWTREGTMHVSQGIIGSGITSVLEKGDVFEKAGVNFSHVKGFSLPPSAKSLREDLDCEKPFEALGVSLVIHPDNPYVPTSHANIRFFMMGEPDDNPVWWFGGGYDLTPYYGFDEDCRHWHSVAKHACDPFGENIYSEVKKWCDEYFYLKHRQEPRGIGGVFFDDWNRWSFERCFEFMRSIGDSYEKAYWPIVERRKNMAFGEREKQFQRYRRGRYAEFNLIYDRGTLFGLQSGGRTESILMSLPPHVEWGYNVVPEAGTPEANLLTDFLVPKEWI